MINNSQVVIPIQIPNNSIWDTRTNLVNLLNNDLDFHNSNGNLLHSMHSFPAKFPPQLPRLFVESLTQKGDTVLDPMAGSGTTILEATLSNRRAIGYDLDPLAILMAKVKTSNFNKDILLRIANSIIDQATFDLWNPEKIKEKMISAIPEKNLLFIDYWFAADTQLELFSLSSAIKQIEDPNIRSFFELVFSSIIITKSGGVSLAFDLAHTRPHRAKIVFNKDGKIIIGNELHGNESKREKLLTKKLKSALEEFKKKVNSLIRSLQNDSQFSSQIFIGFSDAQRLPLKNSSIDLIISSPPYATNAIDYMRAHKFSLVWLGYQLDDLAYIRGSEIGAESQNGVEIEHLPPETKKIIENIFRVDQQKGKALLRYYSEMKRALSEMFRVLKPDKSAIIIIGNSNIRKESTETHLCLAEIGNSIGFEIPHIGVRHIERNKRMMPVGNVKDQNSMIQQRMHEEYVIGFYKPKEG